MGVEKSLSEKKMHAKRSSGGLDRLMMILERKVSIREVMAYPKTGSREDLMFGSPSPLPKKKVEEMNIRVI
ncbi:MAG: hypothetical protein ACKOXB_09630 [Flavobacteriales bacterium]